MKTAVITILILAVLCVVVELFPTSSRPAGAPHRRTRVIPLQELRQANWRPESRLRELFRKLTQNAPRFHSPIDPGQPGTSPRPN